MAHLGLSMLYSLFCMLTGCGSLSHHLLTIEASLMRAVLCTDLWCSKKSSGVSSMLCPFSRLIVAESHLGSVTRLAKHFPLCTGEWGTVTFSGFTIGKTLSEIFRGKRKWILSISLA